MTHSVMSDSANPLSVAFQAPLSVGLSRQEYWSGLPCLSSGDLPYPGINPGSLALQILYHWIYLVAQMIKNLPAMQETQVLSLGLEDAL